jgi:anti-sigma B factor antagonist
MLFNLSTDKDASTLRIEGELDALSVVELRPIITKISEDRPSRVLVDLSHLRLIDSSGVGAIVALFKAVRAYDGTLSVLGVHGQPLAILRLLRLDRVLLREVVEPRM